MTKGIDISEMSDNNSSDNYCAYQIEDISDGVPLKLMINQHLLPIRDFGIQKPFTF